MATTLIAPIQVSEVNNNLYVGEADLTTIQSAVDFARNQGGYWNIVIPHGYSTSDAISSVTGGTAQTILRDERYGQMQLYGWSGSSFTPFPFEQLAGFIATGMPTQPVDSVALGFDPTGTAGIGTANLVVSANPGKSQPSLNVKFVSEDGSGSLTALRFNHDNLTGWPTWIFPTTVMMSGPAGGGYNAWIGDLLYPTGPDKGMYIQALESENAIDLQGQTYGGAYDQTIRLQPNGGNLQLGMNATIDEAGGLTAVAAHLSQTLAVDGDTQLSGNLNVAQDVAILGAASFDGGITGPVNVSGDLTATGNIAAVNASFSGEVDASTLSAVDASFDNCLVNGSPVRTFANSGDQGGMEWPPAGIGVSTGTAWDDSIDPATLATYPAAGIAVSTGTAWGAPIDPATIAFLNRANIFTGTQTINGDVAAFNLAGSNVNVTGTVTAPNINGTNFTAVGRITSNGNITVNGFTGFPAISRATSQTIITGNALGMELVNASGLVDQKVSYFQVAQGTSNTVHFGFQNDAANQNHDYFTIIPAGNQAAQIIIASPWTTIGLANPLTIFDRSNIALANYPTTPNINSDATNLFIQSAAVASAVYINWDQGQYVNFGNGSKTTPGITAQIDNQGRIFSTNQVSAGEIPAVTSNARHLYFTYDFSGNQGIIASLQEGVGFTQTSINPFGGNVQIGNGTLGVFFSDRVEVWGNFLVNGNHTATISGALTATRVNISGTPFVLRGDGGSAIVDCGANFIVGLNNSGGNLSVQGGGIIASGAKAFRVEHPLDKTKYLTHAAVEGPEAGVYYRGESETVDGYVVITLPDYFEALTHPENRSVQLTMIADAEPPVFARLATGRVQGGKFTVYSSEPSVKFFWEVKAVRDDIDPLEVVSEKPEETE